MLSNYLYSSMRYLDDSANATDFSGFGLTNFNFAPTAAGSDIRFNDAAASSFAFGSKPVSNDVVSINTAPAASSSGADTYLVTDEVSAPADSIKPAVVGMTTIDFDDLPFSSGSVIPANYEGLTWTNMYHLDPTTLGPSGYTNGMVSSPNVAYNGFGNPAGFSSATDFDLDRLSLTGAWRDGLDVLIEAFDDGVLVDSVSVSIDSDAPTLVYTDFKSIDEVLITTSGGVENPDYSGSGTHFALDDLIFNSTPGDIIGRVFNDKNLDGVKNGTDNFLENRTVYIDANNNGLLDAGEMSTTTNANGWWGFLDLDPGQYVVRQVVPEWYTQTVPGPDGFVIDLDPGEVSTTSWFGTKWVKNIWGAASGTVYHDYNANGVENSVDPGLEGWRVWVDENDNGVYDIGEAQAWTDANGDYLVTAVQPGTYNMYVDIPTGTWEDWYQTEPMVLGSSAPEAAAPAAEMSVADRMEIMKVAAAASTIPSDMPSADLTKDHVEGQLIVKMNPLLAESSAAEIASLQASMGATVKMATKTLGIEVWEISSMSLEEALKVLNDNPLIQFAEPDYIVSVDYTPSADVVPNDPSFGSLYGMHNTGQTGGTPDADIDAPEAWDIHTGSSNVIVGVIDTGVDYTHPDLDDNMWVNTLEANGTPGVDDDGNGFIDDIYGWDFYNNDSDPMDDNDHGTHVSGTIGAEGNNSVGVVGVNWDVSIMALKFLGAGGSGPISAAVAALEYATMMGADLTNNSWGGGGFSAAMSTALDAANAAGALFIAAAGNHGGDNDASPYYPATYSQDNVIAVAATDDDDLLASFSGYGATTVDLAAPGVQILSTIAGGGYASFNGTSMATPHVAGVAALIKALDPSIVGAASVADWKAAILDTVDPIAALSGVVLSGGRLNAFNALDALDATPPGGLEVTFTAGTTTPDNDFGIAGGATPYKDTIEGTEGPDTIYALNGGDTINGNGGDDFIHGGGSNDKINGGPGDDTILGAFGNDTIYGSAGADSNDGGPGAKDLVDYRDSPAGISVVLDFVGVGGDAAGDTFANIEYLTGSDFDDILIGNGDDNVINGRLGDDLLMGLDGDDYLKGGTGEDIMLGGDGDDIMNGGRDDDIFTGGAGGDIFEIENQYTGDDTITDFAGGQGDRVYMDVPGITSYGDLTKSVDINGNAVVSWNTVDGVQSLTFEGKPTTYSSWFVFGPVPSSTSGSSGADAAEDDDIGIAAASRVYETHDEVSTLFASSSRDAIMDQIAGSSIGSIDSIYSAPVYRGFDGYAAVSQFDSFEVWNDSVDFGFYHHRAEDFDSTFML